MARFLRSVSPLYYLAAGLLIGLAVGWLAWKGSSGGGSQPTAASDAVTTVQPVEGPVVGALAPDFTLRTVDGQVIRLKDLRGTPVLINFWATWCEPCKIEMPLLERRYREYGPSALIVVGVDFDEPPDVVAAYRDELGLTFPLALDPGGKVQALYRVIGYPTTFFLDRQGMIRAQHVGLMDESQLDDYLKVVEVY